MRIICDECGYPVSGTVKRTAGNLNLHPECLAQLGNREPNQQLTAVSWLNQGSSVSMLVERRGVELTLSPGGIRNESQAG